MATLILRCTRRIQNKFLWSCIKDKQFESLKITSFEVFIIILSLRKRQVSFFLVCNLTLSKDIEILLQGSLEGLLMNC